jgi:hypothetical protein
VFDRHLQLGVAGDFERDLAENYSPDVLLFCEQGLMRGHQAIRESATRLLLQLPQAYFEFDTRIVVEDYAYLVWKARSDRFQVDVGADTFVIRDGLIQMQSIFYRLR